MHSFIMNQGANATVVYTHNEDSHSDTQTSAASRASDRL